MSVIAICGDFCFSRFCRNVKRLLNRPIPCKKKERKCAWQMAHAGIGKHWVLCELLNFYCMFHASYNFLLYFFLRVTLFISRFTQIASFYNKTWVTYFILLYVLGVLLCFYYTFYDSYFIFFCTFYACYTPVYVFYIQCKANLDSNLLSDIELTI